MNEPKVSPGSRTFAREGSPIWGAPARRPGIPELLAPAPFSEVAQYAKLAFPGVDVDQEDALSVFPMSSIDCRISRAILLLDLFVERQAVHSKLLSSP